MNSEGSKLRAQSTSRHSAGMYRLTFYAEYPLGGAPVYCFGLGFRVRT